MFKKIKGIYLITRKPMDVYDKPCLYIGQSNDIWKRINEHCNSTSLRIDSDIAKYGIDKFTFEVLEVVNSPPEDRDRKEQEYIKQFIYNFGEDFLYNSQSGGKSGSSVINEKTKEELNQKKVKIREIFEKVPGFSIYLVAEHFDVSYKEVIEIRKPVLEKMGLKYNSKLGIFMDSKNIPVKNWSAGTLTKRQIDLYSLLQHEKISVNSMCEKMEISKSDFENFIGIKDYVKYTTAEEECDLSLLK